MIGTYIRASTGTMSERPIQLNKKACQLLSAKEPHISLDIEKGIAPLSSIIGIMAISKVASTTLFPKIVEKNCSRTDVISYSTYVKLEISLKVPDVLPKPYIALPEL